MDGKMLDFVEYDAIHILKYELLILCFLNCWEDEKAVATSKVKKREEVMPTNWICWMLGAKEKNK